MERIVTEAEQLLQIGVFFPILLSIQRQAGGTSGIAWAARKGRFLLRPPNSTISLRIADADKGVAILAPYAILDIEKSPCLAELSPDGVRVQQSLD